MAFDGNGNYTPPAPAYPVLTQTVISSADFNAIISDIASALSLCLTRDSQGAPTVDLNLFTKKIINLGAPSAATDAARKQDVDDAKTYALGLDTARKAYVDTATLDRDMAGFRIKNVPTVPTAGTDAVNQTYVLGLSNNLPSQTGKVSKVLGTDGVNSYWRSSSAMRMYAYSNFGGL